MSRFKFDRNEANECYFLCRDLFGIIVKHIFCFKSMRIFITSIINYMPAINSITIRKRLKSDIIKLGNQVKPLLGKNVEITIREVTEPKPVERKWRFLGSVSLGKELDSINIRDFAHDD